MIRGKVNSSREKREFHKVVCLIREKVNWLKKSQTISLGRMIDQGKRKLVKGKSGNLIRSYDRSGEKDIAQGKVREFHKVV